MKQVKKIVLLSAAFALCGFGCTKEETTDGRKTKTEEPSKAKPASDHPKAADEKAKPASDHPKPASDHPKAADEKAKPASDHPKAADEEAKPASEHPKATDKKAKASDHPKSDHPNH